MPDKLMDLHAAIVGCGRIACLMDDDPARDRPWTHAGAYRGVDGVRVDAVVDPDAAARRGYMDRFGRVDAFSSLEALLEDRVPDLVSICTPPELHAAQVIACAHAGVKGIFCEKPMALTVDDALHMIHACEASGAKLAVNHTRRWDARYRQVKAWLGRDAVGSIVSVTGRCSGGLVNTGSHLLDLMLWYAGPVEDVRMQGCGTARGDRQAWGVMAFAGGAKGFLEVLDEKRYIHFEVDVIGRRGRLRVESNGAVVGMFRSGKSRHYSDYEDLLEVPVAKIAAENRMLAAVRELCGAVSPGGGCLSGSGHDGLSCVRLVSAVCQSMDGDGARIRLSDADPGYRILSSIRTASRDCNMDGG